MKTQQTDDGIIKGYGWIELNQTELAYRNEVVFQQILRNKT